MASPLPTSSGSRRRRMARSREIAPPVRFGVCPTTRIFDLADGWACERGSQVCDITQGTGKVEMALLDTAPTSVGDYETAGGLRGLERALSDPASVVPSRW
jgi:hypothetical protein